MTAPQVVQPPNYHGPHDFLMISMLIAIVCAVLNLLSLSFGIPSVVLAELV